MNSKVQTSLKSDIDKLIHLYRSKNFNSALNLSNELLKLNQDNPFLLNINGIINLSLENWQDSLLAFKKTLKQDNKFVEAYNNLGVTYSHLGKNDKAIKNYKKALELNKDYASAYNNLATQYDDFGEYPIAIKNYSKALKCNPEHLNAQNNLIRILNFYKTDLSEDSSIIKANNKIQEVRSKFFSLKEINTPNVSKFIKECNNIIKKNLKKTNFLETQIHKRNGENLNCDRHKKVFNQYNIIPKYCFSCFKVQIELKEVCQLIKLFFIFNHLTLPKNNIRKCFIDLRENINGNYKALIYCSSVDEAKIVSQLTDSYLKKFLKCFKLNIKRGCTEFDFSFPGYKDVKKINEIVYNEEWKQKEKLIDIEIANGSQKGKKKFSRSINDITLSDMLIINNWLTYAKIIGDESYKKITSDFIFSEHISRITNKFKS
jgi:hypothetical protein